jgi:hypothetical protein
LHLYKQEPVDTIVAPPAAVVAVASTVNSGVDSEGNVVESDDISTSSTAYVPLHAPAAPRTAKEKLADIRALAAAKAAEAQAVKINLFTPPPATATAQQQQQQQQQMPDDEQPQWQRATPGAAGGNANSNSDSARGATASGGGDAVSAGANSR